MRYFVSDSFDYAHVYYWRVKDINTKADLYFKSDPNKRRDSEFIGYELINAAEVYEDRIREITLAEAALLI